MVELVGENWRLLLDLLLAFLCVIYSSTVVCRLRALAYPVFAATILINLLEGDSCALERISDKIPVLFKNWNPAVSTVQSFKRNICGITYTDLESFSRMLQVVRSYLLLLVRLMEGPRQALWK